MGTSNKAPGSFPDGQSDTAVLLLAHGSPDKAEDIPDFLRAITGGRSLPQQVVDEVTHRYSLIGFSALTKWTLQQRDQLAALLHLPVYVGMRNWKPSIADAVKAITARSCSRAIAICMAPQNSRTSVGLYRDAVSRNVPPFTVDFVDEWHDQPLLVKAFAEKLSAGLKQARDQAGCAVPVIFTAHSVPARTISDGDHYEVQARETARLVGREASLASAECSFAFQSQGMSGGPWIGPTVEETIVALKAKGHAGVFVQPIGFLCDHVEILYDIDVMFKQFAEKHGMSLWRADSLNGSPLLTAAIADIVKQRLLQSP